MAYNYENQIPEWGNEGTEPSENLKANGFQFKQQPSAPVFNWFWNRVFKWLNDLRAKLSELHTRTAAVDDRAETLSKKDYTVTGELALTSISTVDGSGSGLDADTVDGKHASEFATAEHTHTNYALTGHTHAVATSTSDGFMTPADMAKIDGIADGANNYVHPATHPASMITETSDIKIMTAAERTKLAGIEAGANIYTHPSTHPSSMITDTSSVVMMTAAERTKLAGIADGANKYVHPSTHPASMFSGLASAIADVGFSQITYGSYVGTGEGGSCAESIEELISSAYQVSLPFSPTLFMITYANQSVFHKKGFLYGQGSSVSYSSFSGRDYFSYLSGSTFYCVAEEDNDATSLNYEGTTYHWIAIK